MVEVIVVVVCIFLFVVGIASTGFSLCERNVRMFLASLSTTSLSAYIIYDILSKVWFYAGPFL